MPLIGIPIGKLNALIGKDISKEALDELLKKIGCDVQSYALINRFECKECGEIYELTDKELKPSLCSSCGADFSSKPLNEIEPIEVIRIELLPDRPDNFDPGGLARTLRGYLGIEVGLKKYKTEDVIFDVNVDNNLFDKNSYRPYINCAVIKNITLDEELLRIIMKLQENLHWGIGRNRKNASIGVYDLDKITPNITYKAVEPDKLKFVPLFQKNKLYLNEILHEHSKGKAFQHLLYGCTAYPILMDSAGRVLSMPPIINSEETKVTTKTKNLFVDVTGVNETASEKALNIITTSIIELSPNSTIHKVAINYPSGYNNKKKITPNLSGSKMKCYHNRIRKLLGFDLSNDSIVALLKKMRFNLESDGNLLNIEVPAYRNDIMHEFDIVEDVAVAYGYHNITPLLVKGMTIGNHLYEREVANNIRSIMVGLGFIEVVTLMLTSEDDLRKINFEVDESKYIQIENPMNIEQSILRPTLLQGVLNIFKCNAHNELPQRIFEVGDIVLYDENGETKSRELLKLCCAIVDSKSGFSEIQSILFALARELQWSIKLSPIDNPMMISGRSAVISVDGKQVGKIGEVHPEVLLRLGLLNPCGIFEVTI